MSKKSIWVSFDKRPQGDHTRYWGEDNTALRYTDFDKQLVYASGLELSRFTSKRKTKSQLVKKKNQRSLVQRVYHQGGKQYRGDLEAIKKESAAKSQQGKEKKSQKPTSRKAKTTKYPVDKRVHLFHTNALQLAATNDTAKKVHADMVDEWADEAPPLEIVLSSLQEAHELELADAFETSAYKKWTANAGGDDDDDDDSEDEEEDQGEEKESSEETDVESDEENDEQSGEESEKEDNEEQRTLSMQDNENDPTSQEDQIEQDDLILNDSPAMEDEADDVLATGNPGIDASVPLPEQAGSVLAGANPSVDASVSRPEQSLPGGGSGAAMGTIRERLMAMVNPEYEEAVRRFCRNNRRS